MLSSCQLYQEHSETSRKLHLAQEFRPGYVLLQRRLPDFHKICIAPGKSHARIAHICQVC
jgi:hypothetical protein